MMHTYYLILQLEEKPIQECKKTFEELLAERLAAEGDTHDTESPSTPVRKSNFRQVFICSICTLLFPALQGLCAIFEGRHIPKEGIWSKKVQWCRQSSKGLQKKSVARELHQRRQPGRQSE